MLRLCLGIRPCRPAFAGRLGRPWVLPVPPQKPPHPHGLHRGKFVPILQLGKTEPRGSEGKAGITGMAQPCDHPEHHHCQGSGAGGSQGSSPGPAKPGVPGGTQSARNPHAGTGIPSPGCTQVVRKKNDK